MFGMDRMSEALSVLKDSDAFGEILLMFSNPIMGILIGTVLTAMIQSSSASVGVLQALSVTGTIPFSVAIPIIFGQNISAAITPFLFSIGGNTDAKRVAFSNLYIKIISVTVVSVGLYSLNTIFSFGFMDENVTLVTIAIVHSLFNIINSILMMPFIRFIEKMTVCTIRAKTAEAPTPFDTLDERFLNIPTFAIDRCRELVCDMAGIAENSVKDSIGLLWQYNQHTAEQIEQSESLVDTYEDKLSTHFVKISSEKISTEDSRTVTKLLHCISDIERIADHAVNITALARELDDKQIPLL